MLVSSLRNASRQFRDLLKEQEWDYAPSQRAPVPGSPGYPNHPLSRRVGYVAISLLLGITGGFGNALISVNLPYLEGALGLDTYEIVWLPTVYAIMNCLGGGLLFKYRQEYGARSFAITFLVLQLVLITAHLFVRDLGSAILVRAASGLSATALTTLCIYYMAQSFPPKYRPRGLVLGISIPQLAIPIARLVPLDALTLDRWEGLYLLEFGLSALSLACVLRFRLPPSIRQKAFERRDFVTMTFYGAAVACFGSAVGLGPYLWWWDRAWIGWCLAASLPLFVIAFILESGRKKPLIDVSWLSGIDLVRFAVVLVLTRIVLSEQLSGAVAFLRMFG
ncbi:MFS drug efflux transporter (RmrB), partial CDS, partial [Neorhizobium galegae bv. orientalis]